MTKPWRTIGILAFTQVVSWGSLYYAFGVLATDIQRDLGLRAEVVFGAFSWSLLVAGIVATPVGMLLDRFGGRYVMAAGSLLCAVGMAWLSRSTGVFSYYASWTLVGLAMALTLYEAAFATINRKFESGARQAISTLTLFGGFASTLFWPLTLELGASFGWRETYLWYAFAQLFVCLPLHLLLGRDGPRKAAGSTAGAVRSHTLREAMRHPAFWKLALAFSANTFIFSAMAVHMIPLLKGLGHPAAVAVLMATLIGPMQVAGRLGEMTFARQAPVQSVGVFTFAALPAALLVLYLFGAHAWSVAVFCVLYGLSNGILTIVRGTLPRALFGPENYGAIAGALAGPSLFSKAAGPFVASAILQVYAAPSALVLAMLAVSLLSLGYFVAAVRTDGSRVGARVPAME